MTPLSHKPNENQQPKLLDQVRQAIRTRHYSLRTEGAYVGWVKRFVLFLYQEVLKQEIGWLNDVVRAKKPQKLPVVLTREEVKAVVGRLSGAKWIMANLLYGSGLRLMECLRLRVKLDDQVFRA